MNRTVLITGGSGKLGGAIARHLAPLGWHLVLTARDAARCDDLVRELCDAGARAQAVALDLSEAESVESLPRRLADQGVAVTHVVSNARSLDTLALDPDGSARADTFMEEFAIDVVGPYRMLMGFANEPRHDLRAVVTIGSQYGEVAPNPALYDGDLSRSPVQYGVAKAALHHLTRELAVRLAPKTRVNGVAFGGFAGRTDAAFRDRYARMVPLGRMLEDVDAGGPVAFLLDDAASAAVTGHVLVADGGWSIW